MTQPRTLGDVPGLEDLIPNSAVLPTGYTYTEVNPLGEVTADSALGNPLGQGDPFAYNIGFLDQPENAGTEGKGYVAQHDPMASSYMPSGIANIPSLAQPPSAGEVITGGGKGDPYGRTEIDGHAVDNLTAAAIEAAQKDWGGAGVHIMQGSFSTDVSASGNTHAGGGVVDIAPTDGDWVGLMTALRKAGFAAWIRNMPGYGQAGSGAHIHAVLMGDEKLSPEAAVQVQSYLNNDDGLSGSRPDDGPRQYINNRFQWGQRKPKDTGPSWRDQVTQEARTYVGTPFQWGGQDYTGVDSESLLRNVYAKVGVDLPDLSEDLSKMAEPIDLASAKAGDLIGWQDGSEDRYGVYLGGGRLIEAGGPGRVVQVNQLGEQHNTFSVPIQSLIGKTNPLRTPPPASPSPVQHSSAPHPDPHGPLQAGVGALNPNKPKAPM